MVVKHRPVTAVVATNSHFILYDKGIIDECGTELNHAVVVAGVTEKDGKNYWLIKNSWGKIWGEDGYARIDRSQDGGNLCKICFAPVYSVI